MKYIYIFFLIFAVGWTEGFAQEIGPVLQSIEQNNMRLKTARDKFAAEIADAESDNTVIGPTSIEYSPFFHRGVRGLASSELIISQEFGLPKVYRDQKHAIALKRKTNDFAYRTLRRDVLLEAVQLCNDLDFAHQSCAIIAKRRAATDSILTIFKRRLALGHATIIDVQRIRLDSMQLATEAALAEQVVVQVLSRLKTLNGETADDVFNTLNIAYKTEASKASTNLNIFEWTLPKNLESLEMQTAEATLEESRHLMNVSRKSWLPTFTIGFRRNTDLNVGNGGFLIGVSFPFASGARKQRAAQLQHSAAESEMAAARSAEASRQFALVAEATNLQRTLSTYDVTLMQSSLATLQNAVEEGEISLTEYFNQVENIYSILQQRLDTEKALVKTISELHREEL